MTITSSTRASWASRARSAFIFLRKLFAGWFPLRDPATELIHASRSKIVAHYRKLSNRVGFPVLPPEFVANLAGYWMLRANMTDEAIDLFNLNVANYPDSANVYDSLGEVLMQVGRILEAKATYRRAIACVWAGSGLGGGVHGV